MHRSVMALAAGFALLVSGCSDTSSDTPDDAPTAASSSASADATPAGTTAPVASLEEKCGQGASGPIESVRPDAESDIRFGRVGSGSIVAIFLHQAPSDMCGWMDYVGAVTQEDTITALTVDACDKGDTRCSTAVQDDAAAFLTPLVAHARDELGAERVVVVGASSGGAIALAGGQEAGADAVVDLSGPASWQEFTEVEPAAAATTVPLLMVCAKDDIRMSPARLRAALDESPAEPKLFVDPPEGGHGWDMVTEGSGENITLSETGKDVLAWITGDYKAVVG